MRTENRVEALVESAIFDSYNSALIRVYEDIAKEKALVWVSQEDACNICGNMYGVKFDIEETDGLIPAHPFCRCFWVSEGEFER